jgi:16S rRNA (cytosine967-C5)-methyltransferase
MTRPAVDSLAFALGAAARAVAAVIGGRNLDVALAALDLPGAARPAAMDLAYGTLRGFGRGDFFLARLMERPVADPETRGLLLAALHRLETRPADVHTTVDQAVTVAAGLARGRYQALVNGVLRNFLRRRDELVAAAGGDETAHWRHPRWWLAELRAGFPERWRQIAETDNGRAPMTLRVNRRRVATTDFQRLLADAGIESEILGEAGLRLGRPVPVERLPGFTEGLASVQDWGAQQAAPLLDARAGMRVLDACAAPGGKTAHLLELADVDLTALELDAARACRIGDTLRRLGLRARVEVADCRDAAWWDGRPFDRILADVPCSASGVARRHPDIKWLRRPGDVARFAGTQCEILDALWRRLAPGGKMLYATCSLFREENGRQIAAFVARHGDAQRLPMLDNDERCEWQLLPDADHDGFYYALLAKGT